MFIFFTQFIFSLIHFLHPYLRDLCQFCAHLQHWFSILSQPHSFLILPLKTFLSFILFFFYTFYAMSFVSDFPRQCSDQPETGIAYMTFLELCLYKKIGLRKNDTRKLRKETILSDPDTNSLLHVHFVSSSAPSCYALWVSSNTLLNFSSGTRVTESRDTL